MFSMETHIVLIVSYVQVVIDVMKGHVTSLYKIVVKDIIAIIMETAKVGVSR